MSHLTRYSILLALSLSCAGFCGTANSQASLQNKSSKKATGSISGHVSLKSKGKAGIVISVRVGDFGPQMGPLIKGTTDLAGNYRITDLPAGTYQVAPIAPAFVVSEFNSSGLRSKTLILSEGENLDGVNFSIVRGGVITGKVTHADGRPVVEERINIIPAEQTDGRAPSIPMSSVFQTDDRGIYRVFGLPAGRYKVSVGQAPDTYFGGGAPGRPNYERVFYPDVNNANEAKVVELGEGTEATNIDITVGQALPGFSAAGVVIDSATNQPLANLRFGLQRIIGERDANFMGTAVLTDRLGIFRFENLAPGKYSVFILPQQNSDLRVDPVVFDIVDQDITGITLRAVTGASVSGVVILDGNYGKAVQNKLAQLRLQAYVRSEGIGGGWGGQASLINAEGSFRLGGLPPGLLQFQLTAIDRASLTGFVLSRVERDGVVLPAGIEIKSGEHISGVRVVVVYGSGSIRGTIKVENGPLPEGARLMVRLAKPEDRSFVVRPPEVDARGRFAIEGVPAGTYDLYVYCFIPGARARQPSSKQSVIANEGSVTNVEAVIDLEGIQPANP